MRKRRKCVCRRKRFENEDNSNLLNSMKSDTLQYWTCTYKIFPTVGSNVNFPSPGTTSASAFPVFFKKLIVQRIFMRRKLEPEAKKVLHTSLHVICCWHHPCFRMNVKISQRQLPLGMLTSRMVTELSKRYFMMSLPPSDWCSDTKSSITVYTGKYWYHFFLAILTEFTS